jgi:hypothetical protein
MHRQITPKDLARFESKVDRSPGLRAYRRMPSLDRRQGQEGLWTLWPRWAAAAGASRLLAYPYRGVARRLRLS